MNQGIPKSVSDALANERSAEQHPSPDLLNGYVEQSLSAKEKAGVTQHLAVCEDCREVVFLASAAASQPFDAAIIEPARVWRGWKWLVPAVAMLALGSSVLVEHRNLFAPHQIAMRAANHQSGTLPSQPVGSQAATDNQTNALMFSPAPQATPNQQEHIRANLTGRNKRSAQDEVAAAAGAKQTQNESREALADLAEAAPSPTTPSPAVVARNAAATSSAATAAAPLQAAVGQGPSARAFGAVGQSSLQSMKKAAPSGISGDASYRSLTIRSQWRITDQGHLERSQADDKWTQVLAAQPIRFRAVAVVGNDVWAGGNNGALFHSVDGGEHWAQVVLSADGHPETGAVASIHFDTVSQGSVRTETGSTWTTSDRGQSWNK